MAEECTCPYENAPSVTCSDCMAYSRGESNTACCIFCKGSDGMASTCRSEQFARTSVCQNPKYKCGQSDPSIWAEVLLSLLGVFIFMVLLMTRKQWVPRLQHVIKCIHRSGCRSQAEDTYQRTQSGINHNDNAKNLDIDNKNMNNEKETDDDFDSIPLTVRNLSLLQQYTSDEISEDDRHNSI